jgi:hypothetical protein
LSFSLEAAATPIAAVAVGSASIAAVVEGLADTAIADTVVVESMADKLVVAIQLIVA